MIKSVIPLIFFLTLCFSDSYALHLTGGSLSYSYIDSLPNGDKRFEITLSMYRDCNSTTPLDSYLYIGIFKTSTRSLVARSSFPLDTSFQVNLNKGNPCVVLPSSACIEKGVYKYTATLSRPTDSAGYTFTVQRCCRHGSIVNAVNPLYYGQTYFATLTQVGFDLKNSNPLFVESPPFVACLQDTFKYSMRATDIDGDSLHYYLSLPYNGGSRSNPRPTTPSAPPYQRLIWQNGFSTTQQITGAPTISINDSTGQLFGYPTVSGFYVFSINVEEFRNGKSLGFVNSDILTTVAPCPYLKVEIAPQTLFCNGLTQAFTAINTNPFYTYKWNFGDTLTTADTATTLSTRYQYPDTGWYNVKLLFNKNTICEDSTSRRFYIYHKTVANLPNNIISCKKSPISFKNSSFGTTYEWDFGDPINTYDTSSLQAPKYLYSDTGLYWAKITVEKGHFCERIDSTIVHFYDSSFVKIKPQDTYCEGLIYKFINQSYGQYSSLWDFGFSQRSNDQSYLKHPIATYPDTGMYEVTLTINKNHVCEQKDTALVYILRHPKALFDTQNFICVNDTVIFKNKSVDVTHYMWSLLRDKKIVKTSTDSNFISSFNSSVSKYEIILIANLFDKCKDTITLPIDVKENPVSNFIIKPNVISVLNPYTDIINMTNYTSFFKANESIYTSNVYNINFPNDGVYPIKQIVINRYGCKDSLSKNLIVTPKLLFYAPKAFSPNSDGLNDEFLTQGVKLSNFTLTIFNKLGKAVFKTNNQYEGWKGEDKLSDSYFWLANFSYNKVKYTRQGYINIIK